MARDLLMDLVGEALTTGSDPADLVKKATAMLPAKKAPFACMECGRKFRTVAAAEKATYSVQGCPKCGGADIQEAL